LVADTSMMTFHEDGDVETYILTIMNMVSALYRDASIGNSINVVVVRIILLEDEMAQVNTQSLLVILEFYDVTHDLELDRLLGLR